MDGPPEFSNEPLTSYAIGLLALAMELNEVATEEVNREDNKKLVPHVIRVMRQEWE